MNSAEAEIPCEVPSRGRKLESNDSSYEESEGAIINDSKKSEDDDSDDDSSYEESEGAIINDSKKSEDDDSDDDSSYEESEGAIINDSKKSEDDDSDDDSSYEESEGAIINDSKKSEDDDSDDDSSYEESEGAIINDSKKSEDDDSDDSEESDFSIGYDSDDPAFEILEGKSDPKIWKQYYKEWDESEGFDITVHPGTSFMAPLVQLNYELIDPETKEIYIELCKLGIDDFNSKNDKLYVFDKIVKVNATYAAGEWLYFTFNARDTTVDAINTFQALGWNGFDGTIKVNFCRLKISISDEDKKKKKKKKKKKSHRDGKAATEVEQDKPTLVKSFDDGLVIEELSKGNPRGKKVFVNMKVGVRYTAKLEENDKVYDTNVGIGDPLEFVVVSRSIIKGFQIGVLDMRVGDKRRITIPPNLGYGDEGLGDLVPPDSWLVIEVELIYATYAYLHS